MMNSAALPRVMQSVVTVREQIGIAFTDQQGEPVGDVQLKMAPEFMLKRYVQP